jgi:hypothetical protein
MIRSTSVRRARRRPTASRTVVRPATRVGDSLRGYRRTVSQAPERRPHSSIEVFEAGVEPVQPSSTHPCRSVVRLRDRDWSPRPSVSTDRRSRAPQSRQSPSGSRPLTDSRRGIRGSLGWIPGLPGWIPEFHRRVTGVTPTSSRPGRSSGLRIHLVHGDRVESVHRRAVVGRFTPSTESRGSLAESEPPRG